MIWSEEEINHHNGHNEVHWFLGPIKGNSTVDASKWCKPLFRAVFVVLVVVNTNLRLKDQ